MRPLTIAAAWLVPFLSHRSLEHTKPVEVRHATSTACRTCPFAHDRNAGTRAIERHAYIIEERAQVGVTQQHHAMAATMAMNAIGNAYLDRVVPVRSASGRQPTVSMCLPKWRNTILFIFK